MQVNIERQIAEQPEAAEKFSYLAMPFPEERQVMVRAYFKYELAELYGISMPTLLSFIKPFLADFEAIGYSKSMKILTPKMVSLLFDRVGRP